MPKQYPPSFHFVVQWGGTRIGFSEVTGLSQETQASEYRDGSNPDYSRVKNPGQRKFDNITLTRGVVKDDGEFFKWVTSVKRNNAEKRDLILSLLNEKHVPVKTWKLRNAFPVKIVAPEFNAKGSDVAMESIELAHEGLELE